MPIVVPDGLGTLVDFGVKHFHTTAGVKPWYTTYQGAGLAEMSPELAAGILFQLASAEQGLTATVVNLLGGWARRHFAKTVQPLGDTVTYNATNHVNYSDLLPGLIDLAGAQQLPVGVVLDIIRNCEYGNPGHIEVRGALDENSVDSAFGGYALDDPTDWTPRVETWFDVALEAFVSNGWAWVIAGEPQVGPPVRTTVNNKHRTVRNYGPTIIRQVNSASIGRVRPDKNDARFFNRQG